VPDWFSELRLDTAWDLDRAEDAVVEDHSKRRQLEDRLAVARDALAEVDHAYSPYRTAVDEAAKAANTARQHRWSAERELRTCGLLHRRAARHALQDADFELYQAIATLESAEAVAEPHASRHADARREVEHVHDQLRHHELFSRMNDHIGTADFFRRRLDALTGWHHWARGDDLDDERLAAIRDTLTVDGTHDPTRRCSALGHALQTWAESTGVELPTPSQRRTDPTRRDRTIELGL
jgi:hypothetical protein